MSVLPKAGNTWQAGAFMKSTDSGWIPCIAADTVIHGIAAQTQASSSVATTKVYVHRITSAETKLLIGSTSGGNDDVVNPAYIGGNYGIGLTSCVYSLSFGCDSSTKEILKVHQRYCDVATGRGVDTSDSPGFAIVSVVQSALDGEATGV